MKCVGYIISYYGWGETCIHDLGGEIEEKRPLVRPRPRREDDIKMNLKEIGCGSWTRFIWLKTGTSGGFNAVVHFRV
jgi:hypothetical protein